MSDGTFMILVGFGFVIMAIGGFLIESKGKDVKSRSGEDEVPKTKYDWSKVPHWVNWIHTDEGGFAFGSKGKPLRGYLHSGFWYGGGKEVFLFWPRENRFNETNWRESLEERPNRNNMESQV